MDTQLTILENGLRIATLHSDSHHSCAVGVRVETGASEDSIDLLGISHFAEHMMFKGTKSRSYAQIAQDFESRGIQENAYTGIEEVYYYATCLPEDAIFAMESLCEMLRDSIFPDHEVEFERNVVHQEIAMYKDDPSSLAYFTFHSGYWSNHCYGKSILGSEESLSRITSLELLKHQRERYAPNKLILTSCGALPHSAVVAIAEKYFGADTRSFAAEKENIDGNVTTGSSSIFRDIEQAHVYLGYSGPTLTDSSRFAFAFAAHVLGSGMNSRLFRELRDKRGLVYSVHSSILKYSQSGCLLTAFGSAPATVHEAVEVCNSLTRDVFEHGITELEFLSAKKQIRAKFLTSLDSTQALARRLANDVSIFGKVNQSFQDLETLASFSLEKLNSELKSLTERVSTPYQSILGKV